MPSVKFVFAEQGNADTSGNSRFQAHIAKLKPNAAAMNDPSSKASDLNP